MFQVNSTCKKIKDIQTKLYLFQYEMAQPPQTGLQPTRTGSLPGHSATQHAQLAHTGHSGDVDIRHTEVLQVICLRSLKFSS